MAEYIREVRLKKNTLIERQMKLKDKIRKLKQTYQFIKRGPDFMGPDLFLSKENTLFAEDAYPWSGMPEALDATSPIISARVGWAWMVWAISSEVSPFSMARVASAMRSVAWGPIR